MPTLREQFIQFEKEGTTEQARDRVKELLNVQDLGIVAPYMDYDIKEIQSTLSLVPGYGKKATQAPTTPVKAPKVVAPTSEPELPPVGLPEPVTARPEGTVPVGSEPQPEKKEALIDYQGTVRVPFLEEVGIVSPYKGKEVTLELGPSAIKLGSMASGAIEGFSPIASTFLEAMSAPFVKPITEKETDPVLERDRQRKLKRILTVAKNWDQTISEKGKRSGEVLTTERGVIDPTVSFLKNTAGDTKDVLYSLATLFHEAVGITAKSANISRAEAGKKFGQEMGAGMPLIIGSVFEGGTPTYLGLDGVAKSFASRPLTTLLTLLPIFKAAKRIGPTKAIGAAGEAKLKAIWQKSKAKLPWDTVSKQIENLAIVRKTSNSLKRFFEDPTAMETAGETRIAETAIDEPRISRSTAETGAARLGREVAKAEPQDLVVEAEPQIITRVGEGGAAELSGAAEVRVTDPVLQEPGTYNIRGIIPEERLVELVKERSTPEEYARFERVKNELNTLSNKKIVLPDGNSVMDTGIGGAWEAILIDQYKVSLPNARNLFNKARNASLRVMEKGLPRSQAVTRALIATILEGVVKQKLPAPVLNALARSVRRGVIRQRLQKLYGEYLQESRPGVRIVEENFDVTPDGVVRLPRSRQVLGEEAVDFMREAEMLLDEQKFLEEAKVEPKDRNVAKQELTEATERTVVEKNIDVKVAEQKFGKLTEMVDYIYKQMRQVIPEEALEAGPYARRAITARLTEALTQETVSLLRDPKVAAIVRRKILKAAKEAGVPRSARLKLATAFNDFVGDTAALTSEATFPQFSYKGKAFFGKTDLLKTFSELSPKVKNKAVEFTTTKIGFEIAAELEQAKQVGALVAENERFTTEYNYSSPDRYAIDVATRVIANGETRPMVIPHNPKSIANTLRSTADYLAETLANRSNGRVTAEMYKVEILKLAKHIEGFTPMKRVASMLTTKKVPGVPYPKGLENAYANPAFNRSVFWDLAAKQGAIQSGAANWLVSIGNLFKRNVVARSTPSLVNNNISNTLAVSARRGIPAPMVMLSLVEFNSKLYNYLRGKKPGANATPKQILEYELMNQLDKEGLFSSNDLRQDFTRVAKSDGISKRLPERLRNELAMSGVEAIKRRVLDPIQNFFEYTYTRFGDDLFKGEFANQRGTRAIKQLQETQVGYETRFENSSNSHWRVNKLSENAYSVRLYSNTGKALGKKFSVQDLADPRLIKIVAKDGLYYGNELFFDYGRVGNWTKILRSLPITNLTSSFHTWFFKALDIPFIKKGLVYKTLISSDTIPSSDPLITKFNKTKDTNLAARRALMVASVLGATEQRKEEKTVRTPLSYSPSRQELAFVVATTNPNYVLQYALGSRDYTDPTVLGIKALTKTLLAFRDDESKMKELFPPREKLDKMSDKDWNRLQKQRAIFLKTKDGTVMSPKEALELAGVGGSIALNMYDYIREAEKQGKIIDLPGVFRNFGKAFIGSNVARAIDITVAGLTDKKLLPDFASQYTRLGKQEMKRGYRSGQLNPNQSSFIQYAIKEVFGIGWNSIMYLSDKDEVTGRPTVGAVDRYVNGISAELKANLVKPKKDQAARSQALMKQADNEKDRARYEADFRRYSYEAEQIEDAIKTQTELYKDTFERALNKMYVNSNPTK